MDIIDKLLETPCYIMDFLPKQVPMNCGGQFFEVETYLLNHYDYCGLRDRFVGVILKAMCYYPVSVHWGKWIEQPTPEQVTKIIDTILESHSGDVLLLIIFAATILQKLFFKLVFRSSDADNEEYTRRKRLRRERRWKKETV